MPPGDTIFLMRSSSLQSHSLTPFLKWQTESLCIRMRFSKAAVTHCPSLWKKHRSCTQLALQVKAAHRALWPWLEVALLPLHPVPRDLGTLPFWKQGHRNHIQQMMRGNMTLQPTSNSPCIPELAVPPLSARHNSSLEQDPSCEPRSRGMHRVIDGAVG